MTSYFSFVVLLSCAHFAASSVDIYYPDAVNPCIRFQATINISIIATFQSGPQAVQFPLNNYTVLDTSKCSNGSVTAVLNIETSDNITLLFLFVTEDTRAVQMNSHISFIPSNLFPNQTTVPNFTDPVLLNEQKPKPLPPPDKAYICSSDEPILMMASTRGDVVYSGVIDLQQIQVQAFNLNGSEFGPAEDCSQAEITTALPATPSPGKPPTNLYFLEGFGDIKCIVLKAGIEFTIPYTQTGGVKSSKVIGMPQSAAVISGACSDFGSSAQMAIAFYGDWLLSLVFVQNTEVSRRQLAASNQYSLFSVTLTYSISKTLFPDAQDLKVDTTVSLRLDPPQLQTDVGFGYQCNDRQTYSIDNGVDISFVNIEYKAFSTENSTNFDPNKMNKCVSPSPTPSPSSGLSPGVVAVIVIVVLAVVGAAGAFVFLRVRRRRSPYDQVN